MKTVVPRHSGRKPWLSFLLLLAPFTNFLDAETVLNFEPAQTHIEWTLDTALHSVHGTFQLKSGTVRFDPATGHASGQLVVDATSGESGSGSRDARMKKHILEVASFPDIVFKPDRVEGSVPASGSGSVNVHGTFLLHGSSHEILMPVQLDVEADHIKATSKFVIPYIEWGLKNPSTLVLRVSEKVAIDMSATGRLDGGGRH
jgi:polyisoprenoid-binding protein YceI